MSKQAIEVAFARLSRETSPLSLALILDWLARMPLTVETLSGYLIFSPDRYVRNRLYDGPAYQALVLCWRNGQRSPIHNHRGSSCGVKVIRGTATETLFTRAPNGLIMPTCSRELPTGTICASADEDIHQISNLQAGGHDLVTLHVYSPPLVRMDKFSLETSAISQWDDPINDPFPLGGGI
jgi:cysteine dioxygenase